MNLEPNLPTTLPGRFQLWVYTVSLGRLVLRSLGSPTSPRPLSTEVMFQDVDAMQVRRAYEPLELRDASTSEIEEMVDYLGAVPTTTRRFIALGEDLRCGWVICGTIATTTNELDHTAMPELLTLGGGLGAAGASPAKRKE